MGQAELPTVEETSPQESEPPIRPYHGPDTTQHQHHLHPQSRDPDAPPFSAWHTITASQTAERLVVDTRYFIRGHCSSQLLT
jgi:Na+-exporting ATPase